MAKKNILCILALLTHVALFGQQRLGINTSTPFRTLEVAGTSDQFIRVHAANGFGVEAGIELFRGASNVASYDWKISNDGGILKFRNSDNNFSVSGDEMMRINSSRNTGIGTISPQARLHVDGGSLITFGGHGYLKTGDVDSYNLAFDPYQILALNDGAPAPLYFQANGGNTNFGLTGGNVYMGIGGGRVGVGTSTPETPLDIADDNFQLFVSNTSDDANNWYIGSSNAGWSAGGNQLLFSPTSSSSDAALRLLDINDNDGNVAPVMIYTSADQTLLLDGNEIDTRGAGLYINHNTDENTLINPSGGMVGIGTSNPQAALHIYGESGDILKLQRENTDWSFSPVTYSHENLAFYYEEVNAAYAEIDGISGQWMSFSDRNFKENIVPAENILERLQKLPVYNYSFRLDEKQKEHVGVIAQEAESLFPEIVRVAEGQYGIAYAQLAALGIKAIQEQQAVIEKLRAKIDLLKEKVKDEKPVSIPTAQ